MITILTPSIILLGGSLFWISKCLSAKSMNPLLLGAFPRYALACDVMAHLSAPGCAGTLFSAVALKHTRRVHALKHALLAAGTPEPNRKPSPSQFTEQNTLCCPSCSLSSWNDLPPTPQHFLPSGTSYGYVYSFVSSFPWWQTILTLRFAHSWITSF